jgi:hypothetical protein
MPFSLFPDEAGGGERRRRRRRRVHHQQRENATNIIKARWTSQNKVLTEEHYYTEHRCIGLEITNM